MRHKTSVTLSDEALTLLDLLGGGSSKRSRLIEEAVLTLARHRTRQLRDQQDIERINHAADALNQEAEAMLDFQAVW